MQILKTWRKPNPNKYKGFYLVFLTLLFVLCSGSSCGPEVVDTNKKPPENPAEKKPSFILVFCDITTSVDKGSIDKVVDKAKQLFDGLSSGSRIVAYPIDDNDYAESFIDYTLPTCEKNPNLTEDVAEIERKGCLDKIKPDKDTNRDELAKKIKSKSDEVAKDTVTKHRSCIIDTLNKANEIFKNKDKNAYQFEVIYLSDMIEECSSKIGSIFMCSKKQVPIRENILNLIDKKYNPDFNLKELVGNNINIVITTKMLGSNENKCLFKDDHQEVWKNVFIKVGYSAEDFSSFSFDTEIPDKFKVKK